MTDKVPVGAERGRQFSDLLRTTYSAGAVVTASIAFDTLRSRCEQGQAAQATANNP